ncbi:MAG: S9 family peptidase [Alphaproteobacteria bacterium]|nr:MAG: S9 family peptidase [Alphaproteobacteria bacterium]
MWRAIGGTLVILFLLGGCGQGETQKSDKGADTARSVPAYSAEAFFRTTSYRLPGAAGHSFSPDGGRLLVTSDESGVFNAYAVDLSSGEKEPLTDSTSDAVFGLSYFPADERVLFTRDQGGNELNHVFVREEDGTSRDLTPGERLKAGFLGWTASGDAFFVTSNERDPRAFDVYRYDATDYSRVLVFENPGLSPAAVSPDGRWLALGRPRTSADSDILLVDLAGDDRTPELITPHEGDVSYSVMGFTPDSGTLIYGTNEHGEFTEAWAYDLARGEVAPLVSADWDVLDVRFSPDGRYRVSAVNEDARTRVEIRDTANGETVAFNGLPAGDLGSVRFDRAGRQVAFTVASDVSPPDIFVADLENRAARRLTRALNPEIAQEDLVTGEVVRFSSYDGLEVPGILYRPHAASAANPVPALVWVHGGPGGQSRRGYNPTIQHLVNHGYAVYAINNRGSSGYGKTFFHLDDKRHGEADLGDVVAARDFLAGLNWIDGERIGIIGGSYGGYMVAAALAFSPDTFDVGIDIFGVTNWVRTLKSIPPWWGSFRASLYDELGDPATDEERLTRISPLFHAGNIKKPLLVVQGVNDPRVLKVESDELVEKVRANGVPVEYVVFPDEGHGFRKRANRIAASEAYVAFLDKYLKGGGAAASAAVAE